MFNYLFDFSVHFPCAVPRYAVFSSFLRSALRVSTIQGSETSCAGDLFGSFGQISGRKFEVMSEVYTYFKHCCSNLTVVQFFCTFLLGTVAYASRPRVQIYSFAYTSRSIHHSHYSYFSYYLVLTPVISLLTKPTPQGSYWLVYCSFVPQHVFLSFLAARSSFS